MSNIQSLKGFQQTRTELEEQSKRLEERRRSLEEKTRVLEEKARVERLAVDRKLLAQILQEENRTHDAAIKELEEKIADLDMQMRPAIRNIPSETPSEPAPETSEPEPETSNDLDALQERAHELLQESEPKESEVPLEAPKKKKRGLF